jgi:DNA invertase Pin-like site-specific DNA recombinase
MRLVAYVRVSREDERPENQEYAIFKWAAERGHQIADGVIMYTLDRVARNLWDLAAVVRKLEGRGKLLLSVREEWLQSVDPKVRQWAGPPRWSANLSASAPAKR